MANQKIISTGELIEKHVHRIKLEGEFQCVCCLNRSHFDELGSINAIYNRGQIITYPLCKQCSSIIEIL